MINVTVSEMEKTRLELAKVSIHNTDTEEICNLDFDFKTVYQRCGIPNFTVLDFLFMASVFYATDKFVRRKTTGDKWTRDIKINIPVYELAKWQTVKENLEKCMSFLTGDIWDIEFYLNTSSLHRPTERRRPPRQVLPRVQADLVCLFSGGLDSLVGAIDWLESNPKGNILLVGHYDGQVSGPKTDQSNLFNHLKQQYTTRIDSLQVRAGQKPSGKETTFRSRSILFLAIGIYAAASIGEDIPLLIPENGTIALNIPLTPSRRGTCSTRTAHPNYLRMLSHILQSVGISNPILNPLGMKTKGEAIRQCKNQQVLQNAIPDSVSCGKSGHKSSWIRRDAKGCGRCVPCIFRRASLHVINADTEIYGIDICSDEVDLTSNKASANDFRAVLAFLGHNYKTEEIKRLLLTSGVSIEEIEEYSNLVVRAMDEVKKLINDKGTTGIKRLIGLT
ncbi:Qat anti-phage system QueC-like protein QatC [Bacillus litorisediminis]|uniref:Qat anti-phage system QueC-like protein QatC n=1 Tax=Bacillus litorisediminis TaxID=2922713 RepID=UPI001FAED50C|nr:Qat anti-phage system QueC-like protein QatC [Bacillus litorisediminis]